MAKTFYRLQRSLGQAQLLFIFLGVAYIMAGSMLLLQRSNMALFQKRPNMPSLVHSTPLIFQEERSDIRRYARHEPRTFQDGEIKPYLSGADQERFRSRNLKIRHLRHYWTQGERPKQENRAECNQSQGESRHKGTYVGCFINDDKQHALGGTVVYDFRKMSSSLCQDTCSEGGYRFAGLEYGTECHCGNRINASRARREDCNLDCRAEKGAPCGGVARLSIYKVEDGLPGHKRYRNVHYQGCFQILTGVLVQTNQSNLTSQLCVEICTDQELPLAALKGSHCLCGHTSSLLLTLNNVAGQLCGWSKPENRTATEDCFQVYSTPVLASRCREKRFVSESSSSLTALSSFPGAGNTWLRHLVELATGFYTGSYYFDGSLYNKGFKGEKDSWKSGRTICVKTHESGQKEIEMFNAAILLIRNPYRCLMAEFNRKNGGHLGYATDAHWMSNEWPEFVESYSSWWVSHALAWLNFSSRVLVVHYEKLQTDLFHQLRLITAFLNVSVQDDRLLCAEHNRDGQFKRPGSRRLTFDPFTLDMRARIGGYIRAVDNALRDRNLSGLPQDYMSR